ncbi:hypothetical protein [Magnetospirillum aberrantis]|uniref:SPOR domain-containing protein n=1 Tax=Magnetospirillum aberrantis SpK TaxID=908842 RepID=A0A7C9QVA3_9PROT|nr:hypothetical protein [Magnetospirillum aberrantis]NFV81444.1 hypothetical protein [Magnetospirillum aberrantis SpK]
MKRLVLVFLAASLAACASEPPPAQPEPQPDPAPMAEEQKPTEPAAALIAEAPMPLAPEATTPDAKMPAAKMMDTATPAAAPVTEPAPKAAPGLDKRTLVYLASYKTEDRAKQGFKTLAKSSPLLARQEPILRSFDLGPKGTWVRLYAMADDEAGRKAICAQVGKRIDECGARNRE